MNSFQILSVTLLSATACFTLLASVRGWTSRRAGLVFTLICISACVALIWPDVTVRIANKMGIGRGADLVFYTAVVVMMIGFWMIYTRLRQLRRHLTLLVRQLAILEGQRSHPQEADAGRK